MKKIKWFLLIFVFSIVGVTSGSAKSNPYPHYEDLGFGKIVNCTWYAWVETKKRTGIELPTWYNVWTWHKQAKKAGYATGKEPKVNSLMVWNYGDGFGGHVAFVTKVDGNNITYDEGGAMNSTGIATNQTITVDEVKAITSDYGFIYLYVPRTTTTTTKKKTTETKKSTSTKEISKSTTSGETTTSTSTTTSMTTSISTSVSTTTSMQKEKEVSKIVEKKNNDKYIIIGVIALLVFICGLLAVLLGRKKK